MSKLAAVWARVSTTAQTETSLQSQIERTKAALESAGYEVPPSHILAVDWSSLDLFACPDFQRLRGWIQHGQIKAVGIFNRDRLEAQGLQRLVFLSECKEAGVELIICQGPPIFNEPEGQLVELALAIGKERSVLRARQGSRDGLHDRAVKRHLPTSHHKVYGYKWSEDRQLIPDVNWPMVKLIFDMALEGQTYYPIIQELKKRGILSPDGLAEWNKATISSILHNPVYAGRYYALKKQAVRPVKRRGNSYGNSSQRKLPLEKAVYLPEIEIVDAPITWEQRFRIFDQLEKHQKLAQRNGRADYLLRGLIFCETHKGKKGEPRRYHGQPRGNSWCYVCPVGKGCKRPYLSGPLAEAHVKGFVQMLLLANADELIKNQEIQGKTKVSLLDKLDKLEYDYNQAVNLEAKLEDRNLLGDIDPEVYERLRLSYRARRQWAIDTKEATQKELAQLEREQEAVDSLVDLKEKFAGRIDSLTKDEWRSLLTSLNFEVHINKEGFGEYDLGLPLNIGKMGNIGLGRPEPG